MKSTSFSVMAALVILGAACSSSSSSPEGSATDKAAVVKNYAAIVHANYDDALGKMRALQKAVDAFVAAPSQAGLEAAKTAWVAARPPYIQSEAFRFYGGPIDSEMDGPEGRINGWPMDENFVDYTKDEPEGGIINKQTTAGTFDFPMITKEVIGDENEKGGEKNLSSGWHAVEFLLWGQDFNAAGPGTRPFTDYVTGAAGTAKNQDRRGAYLKAVTALMVEDFESVAVQWDVTVPASYGAKFVAGSADEAIANMLKGIGSLSASELPKERMNNAYETKDQEEEHSCFSDTTSQDLVDNGTGIENVYLGHYGTVSGPGITDLVKAKAPELDAKTRKDIAAAIDATKAIPKPFDQAILGDDASDGRKKVKAAIDAWKPVADDIVEVATTLGLKINLE